ncbi:ubiquinone biosynthesis protein [Nostoc sp. C057]|uniref:Coq4 family protein n=1 Tax=Nostoc sp. C057 TaxID=2576903 RepID=UPI0015C395C8|nr:Coq4 family protein [Nostoc sp. C057]QLE47157.1 ubiquinone biosynthesis protein [Nostoc sp. C057]
MDKDSLTLPTAKVGNDLTRQMQQINAFQPFLAMLAGDSSLDVVGEMVVALLETPSFEIAVEHLKRDSRSAALIEERYMAPPHDLDTLLQYPPDSLGYLYSMAMKAKGFRAEDLYEEIPIYSDASYVEARLSQTHDIWHIVTGFGVSPSDEIGLQAFHLLQFPYPLAVSLLSSSMMSTLLFNPEELPTLLDAIQTGWEMGKNAKPLFVQKWEEAWEKPLLQWQKELNLFL